MSGKKKEKSRISIGFACNANKSEKLEPFFIGKTKKPQCFNKQSPEQQGFYYWNNKKAWMTTAIFEEWVKRKPSNIVGITLEFSQDWACDWNPALKAVVDAEGDIKKALEAINSLCHAASHRTGLKICIPAFTKPLAQKVPVRQ
ncbi:hypothetical protein SERLA73DRAFT_153116 [Serpula lacrymans var. lacrymans S7.3]|uniref:DDE-1 domain-containing protein n=1 Tax=Serpula lacrymans var. lacrymans (strain S7.3) TaxID=936435 RepID=F8Q0L0_SERL3|nr:hypothetical protein SERLA73DRAFT_153116 [Serpula lacrymans var. lacrymans S7.3]